MLTRYADETGENVCYLPWCHAVDDTLRSQPAEVDGRRTHIGSTTAAMSSFFNGTTRNPNLSADELVELLRAQCAMYKLRCEDYFADSDKFHTGIVNAAQFESALGRMQLVGFALSSENVAALVRCYALEDHLHPTDRAAAEAADSTVKNTALYNSLTQANRHLARVNYKSFLYDINPRNFPIETAEVDPATGSRQQSVNYFASRHRPDVYLDHPETAATADSKMSTFVAADGKSEKECADALLDRIRRLVLTNRIYLSPVFRDFDHVMKSIKEHRTCTAARFARGLATQNIILPERELELLTRKYTTPRADGTPSEEVNYYQFVRDVDPSQAPLPAAAAAGPAARPGAPSAVQRLQQAADNTFWRPATTLEELLERMVREAHARHLRPAAFFLDFDPLRCGEVQEGKFISALTLSGIALQAPEVELLQSSYRSARVPQFINLGAFLRDLNSFTIEDTADATFFHAQLSQDRAQKVVSTAKLSADDAAARAAARLTPAEQQMLQLATARLQHDVRSHNALLMPFFQDFDRYHQGTITETNFRQALARHRFCLSPAECDVLVRYYAPLDDPQRVEYRRFVADVGFEESAPPAPPATAGLLQSAKSTTASAGADPAAVAATVEEVLEKICCFLQEYHGCIDEFFPDGDELRHQHISQMRFRSGLSALGDATSLYLTEDELVALEQTFACAQDPTRVSYPLFAQRIRVKMDAGDAWPRSANGARAARARRRRSRSASSRRPSRRRRRPWRSASLRRSACS
ncbi:hypothetical protein STCU_09761 [Strigomonas culicis]|uniref:EF-hand domain-containing protein n=1 Tax=Strigomonas culicis TaxID=28005 RepID=S9V7A3_9TRYP|nr:hypothetical protein STCU_09761 [Strigomonas culicis]|eukprot:EPY18815.1 hypothetical protein STCU_09761 [Strigomonas culicis]